MANTFVKINTVTVGSGGAGSITFSSIPQTYTDLCVKMSLRLTNAVDVYGMVVSVNGTTTNSGFNWRRIMGTGSSASSTGATSGYTSDVPGSVFTANTFGSTEIYIPNYTGGGTKAMSIDDVSENNGSLAYQTMNGLRWNTTSAITSLVFSTGGTFAQYSTATLYGIKNS